MARGPGQAERRQQELLDLLSRESSLSTEAMARRFSVSAMTIRRDLKVLEESGAVIRRYGGAVPAQRITFEFAFDERRRKHLAEKKRIGAVAAVKVLSDQTIFLDTGTTTVEVARALLRRGTPCRAVTNSLVMASVLWGHSQIQLLLLGGRARRGNPDLVGPATELMLEKLTTDVAFLGCDGLDPARGSFAADIEIARVAELMAANAHHVVVVADRAKVGAAAAARCVMIDDIDELVTDRGADKSLVRALRRRGVTVTLA